MMLSRHSTFWPVDRTTIWNRWIPAMVLILLLGIMPIFLPSFMQRMMGKFLILAIFSISYNIVAGYAGLLSLGQAVYFGVSGYTVAVMMHHFGISSLWITGPAGIFLGTFAAVVCGPIALRVSGMYFLILTFAIGQLFFSLVWNIPWFNVPGMQGIAGLPKPSIGIPGFEWTDLSFYFLVLILFAVAMWLQRRLSQSPFGQSLEGIREGEKRMLALGYNVWLHKYIAFIIGGAFAGLAGVLFVYQNRFIEPAHMSIMTSFLPMAMVIIGGPGTLWGPVVGAATVVFTEYYSSLLIPARWPLILGGLFVLAIMFARKGLAVYVGRLWKRVEAILWKR